MKMGNAFYVWPIAIDISAVFYVVVCWNGDRTNIKYKYFIKKTKDL